MARISGVEIPRNKRVDIALTYVYGVGPARAKEALAATNVNPGQAAGVCREQLQTRGRTARRGRWQHQAPDGHRLLPGLTAPSWVARAGSAYPYQRPQPQRSPQDRGR